MRTTSSALSRIVAFLILPVLVRSAAVHVRVVGRRLLAPLKVTRILTGQVPSLRRLPCMMTGLNVIMSVKVATKLEFSDNYMTKNAAFIA